MGELGKAHSGIGFPDSEQGGQEGIPFFKVSDMNNAANSFEMSVSNNYVQSSQIMRMGWRPIREVPAIFFAKVGAAVLLNRKRLVNQPFLLDNNTMAYSLNLEKWDSLFARAVFETINLASLVQVGALPSYNASDIEGMPVKIPKNKSEQRAIGSFFSRLDALIALHQRELISNQERST